MKWNSWSLAAAGVAACLGAATALAPVAFSEQGTHGASEEQGTNGAPTYTVVDGRADPGTVMGYTIYTGSCMPCHGPDGVGSSFAPSLLLTVQRRTYEDFKESIRDGRAIQPNMIMPAFGDDERIMNHVDDLWRYVSARADGALGRGRPRPIEDGG